MTDNYLNKTVEVAVYSVNVGLGREETFTSRDEDLEWEDFATKTWADANVVFEGGGQIVTRRDNRILEVFYLADKDDHWREKEDKS